MIDRTISFLVATIIIMASALLVSSGLGFVLDLGGLPINMWQTYAGGGLLFLSVALAALNMCFAKHPFYEYWFLICVASVIAACYLS
jgi:hypothetical protein